MRLAPATLALVLLVSTFAAGGASFELETCDYMGLFLRLPPQVVAPHLPPEFRAVVDFGLNIVTVGALRCPDGAYGWLTINIMKPRDPRLAGPAVEGITIWQYQVERFAAGDALGQALADAGAPFTPSSIDVSLGPVAAIATIDSDDATYTIVDAATPPTQGTGNVVYRWRMIGKDVDRYSVVNMQVEPDLASAGTTIGTLVASPGSAAEAIVGPSYSGLLSYGSGYRFPGGSAEVIPFG